MSSKRNLKRTINYVCSDLFAEGIATSLYSDIHDSSNIEVLLTSILVIHNNYIRRVSHIEPGMSAKVYFKDLKEKFTKEIDEITDQLNNIS